MTAQRDPDTLIRAYLDEGVTELPDRAFDAIRADLGRHRQRVVIGRWREPDRSTLSNVAIAAAVVLAVGLAWFNFGPPSSGVGTGPPPTPSASPPPLPSDGVTIEPGRYRISGDPATLPAGMAMVITLGPGWQPESGWAVTRNAGPASGPAIGAWLISNTFVDPCTDHTLRSPEPGPDVDALVKALSNQPGVTAAAPRDVVVDGYRGKSIELTVTADIGSCGGLESFWLWAGQTGDHRYVQDTREVDRIYVLDVDGTRLTFFLRISPTTTAAQITELEAIVASIDIEP